MEFKIEVQETKTVKKSISPKYNVWDIVSYIYDCWDEIMVWPVLAISIIEWNIRYRLYDNSSDTEWFDEEDINIVK